MLTSTIQGVLNLVPCRLDPTMATSRTDRGRKRDAEKKVDPHPPHHGPAV